jgi:hypothetical protein
MSLHRDLHMTSGNPVMVVASVVRWMHANLMFFVSKVPLYLRRARRGKKYVFRVRILMNQWY